MGRVPQTKENSMLKGMFARTFKTKIGLLFKSTLPITIGDSSAQITLTDLLKKSEVVHGTASDGTIVNSPAIRVIGENVAIWPRAEEDKVVFIIGAADLELISKKHLKSRGFAEPVLQASITS